MITAIMMYYGRKRLAEEAIESFLRQDFPDGRLLIVNTHPDPVWFDKEYADIEVINVEDTFNTVAHKLQFAIDHVQTPWFCTWDDDDIFLPHHLSNFAIGIELFGIDKPCRIGGLKRYAWQDGKILGLSWTMCHNFVFKKCDIMLDIHRVDYGYDFQLQRLPWQKIMVSENDFDISFVYRWGTGDDHMSGAGENERRNIHRKKIQKEKYSQRLTEPMMPHWNHDYIQLIRDYNAKDLVTNSR